MNTGTTFYQGKSGLVTGSGSGMGRAMAIAFAAAGAKVLVTDVNAKGGEETVATILNAGGTAKFLRSDVSSASDVEAMVAAAPASNIAVASTPPPTVFSLLIGEVGRIVAGVDGGEAMVASICGLGTTVFAAAEGRGSATVPPSTGNFSESDLFHNHNAFYFYTLSRQTMRAIEDSKVLGSPELVEIKAITTNNVRANEFSLNLKIKRPEPPAEKKEKKA